MTTVVTDSQATTRVTVVFYVKEDTNSPYQGHLTFTPDEYAALAPSDLQTAQLAQYTAWKAVRDAPPPPPQPITQVTATQARRAIVAAGLLDPVEAAMAAATDDVKTLWYTSDPIQRTDPVLNSFAAQLGLTSDQLDALFVSAAGM